MLVALILTVPLVSMDELVKAAITVYMAICNVMQRLLLLTLIKQLHKRNEVVNILKVCILCECGVLYRVYKKKLNRFEIALNFAKQLLLSSFLYI